MTTIELTDKEVEILHVAIDKYNEDLCYDLGDDSEIQPKLDLLSNISEKLGPIQDQNGSQWSL